MAKTRSNPSGIKALLRDERFWQIALQFIVVVAVVAAFSYLSGNLTQNMSRNGIQFGFDFFKNPAGFAIGEDLVGYRAQDTYTKVVQAGILNSLRVMVVGVILATIVGITAGVASFSDNWLVAKISRVYVNVIRNVPLLLQLFFWYLAVYLSAPRASEQIVLPSQNLSWLVMSNKGVNLPGPSFPDDLWVGLLLLVLSFLLIGLLWRSVNAFRQGRFAAGLSGWISRIGHLVVIAAVAVVSYFLLFNDYQSLFGASEQAGGSEQQTLYFKGALVALFSSASGLWVVGLIALAIAFVVVLSMRTKSMVERGEDGKVQLFGLIAIAAAFVAIILFAFNWQAPTVLEGGGATGGMRMSMEYAAIVTGLTFYTGAFIAEIVRAGIQSVSRGQWEAARSVGLSNGKAMRLVVFPQSLRVIIPPLNSEFANLAKNSSLALAIGYPDLYSVANTTFNQTGRPIEVFLVMMATYLTINLLISINMNQLNNAVQFKER
ncbi:MAG: ABC transporter permease subunit [Cyanobacteria bacterium J06649_4]